MNTSCIFVCRLLNCIIVFIYFYYYLLLIILLFFIINNIIYVDGIDSNDGDDC
jgi:hypothetical protein